MRAVKFAAALIAALFFASASSAGTIYNLTATPTSGYTSSLSEFSLTFDDLDLDSLVSLDEVTSFSGLTWIATFYPHLTAIPLLVGIADGVSTLWRFGLTAGADNLSANSTSGVVFTYQLTAVSPVPIPAVFPILAAALGLFGLVGWRRRRRSAAVA